MTSNNDAVPDIISCAVADLFVDDAFNSRGHIAPIDVTTLAKDIQENGLAEPIVITPWDRNPPFKFKVVAGHRRTMAHKLIKRTHILAILRPDLVDDIKARIFNLSENLHREDLNVLQEAKAVQRIFETGVSEEELARKLGKSRGWIQIRAALLKLPERIQEEAAAGVITQPQIRELTTILVRSGATACFEAAKKIKEHRERSGKSLSVNPTRKKLTAKVIRTRTEIFDMMALIRNNLGNGPLTVALAWAAGELTTADILEMLKKEAVEIHGKVFIVPEGTFSND